MLLTTSSNSQTISTPDAVPAMPAVPATGNLVGNPGNPVVVDDAVSMLTVDGSKESSVAEIVAERRLVKKRKQFAAAQAEVVRHEVRELELDQQLAVSSSNLDNSQSS